MSDSSFHPELTHLPSRWRSRALALYSRWLISRRFQGVWIREQYQPKPGSTTLFFLNHSNWWDGLLPLLLNEFRYRQDPRAMMERKQWERYPVFRHIGAFPVDLEHPRKAASSLRFAAHWLGGSGHSLYLFPEGRFQTAHLHERTFQPGLDWLAKQDESVHLVPIGILTQQFRSSRPDLFLKVGPRVEPGTNFSFSLKRSLEELDRLSTAETGVELAKSFECWIGRPRP